jgi:hypothetical protein
MVVVLPFCGDDRHLALQLLGWIKTLGGDLDFECLVVYDQKTSPLPVLESARTTFGKATPLLVHVPDHLMGQWPAAPTWVWAETARYLRRHVMEPWLWLEPDAVPLRFDWLWTLSEAYKDRKKPFMGAIVKSHNYMAGVGIYPPDVARFSSAPFITRKPFDMVMAKETIGYTADASDLIFHERTTTPRTFRELNEVTDLIPASAVLFHPCKDGSLTEVLRQHV